MCIRDSPGTLALLVFALVAVFVWNNNPDLTEFTWRKLWFCLLYTSDAADER